MFLRTRLSSAGPLNNSAPVTPMRLPFVTVGSVRCSLTFGRPYSLFRIFEGGFSFDKMLGKSSDLRKRLNILFLRINKITGLFKFYLEKAVHFFLTSLLVLNNAKNK